MVRNKIGGNGIAQRRRSPHETRISGCIEGFPSRASKLAGGAAGSNLGKRRRSSRRVLHDGGVDDLRSPIELESLFNSGFRFSSFFLTGPFSAGSRLYYFCIVFKPPKTYKETAFKLGFQLNLAHLEIPLPLTMLSRCPNLTPGPRWMPIAPYSFHQCIHHVC